MPIKKEEGESSMKSKSTLWSLWWFSIDLPFDTDAVIETNGGPSREHERKEEREGEG